MILLLDILAYTLAGAVFFGIAWLILDSTGAKSAGPPPHIPPGLDLDAFRAKVHGVESERRGRTS